MTNRPYNSEKLLETAEWEFMHFYSIYGKRPWKQHRIFLYLFELEFIKDIKEKEELDNRINSINPLRWF